MGIFLTVEWDSPPPPPSNVIFGEGGGQSIHGGGATGKMEVGGTFLVRWRIEGV